MLLTVRFGSLDKQIYPAGARNDACKLATASCLTGVRAVVCAR